MIPFVLLFSVIKYNYIHLFYKQGVLGFWGFGKVGLTIEQLKCDASEIEVEFGGKDALNRN